MFKKYETKSYVVIFSNLFRKFNHNNDEIHYISKNVSYNLIKKYLQPPNNEI